MLNLKRQNFHFVIQEHILEVLLHHLKIALQDQLFHLFLPRHQAFSDGQYPMPIFFHVLQELRLLVQ